MFVDYYAILELTFGASPEAVKRAYRAQAFQWHPDRNPGQDTGTRMQAINEAYLILNDPEARERYDREYMRHQTYRAAQASEARTGPDPDRNPREQEAYVFADETLLRWMQNARRQAAELSRMTRDELRRGAGAAVEEMGRSLVSYVGVGMIFLVILAMAKSCE